MRQSSFIAYILILTLIVMQIYARARETFNGVAEAREQVARLQHEIEEVKTSARLQEEHFLAFRQSVATVMPSVLKEKGEGEAGYPVRSLASVVSRSEVDQVRAVIAKTIFETGKKYFRDKNFKKAKRSFRQIIDRYSYTPFVTESYFLLAEAYFQENELEECTRVVQQMIELFPQAELTGFGLIRLGRIYEIQNRSDEAVDIYKTVIRTFPQRDVAAQARASLKGMDQ